MYSELGFTFKPSISESSRYKVSGTFEERNFINYYPNRESLLSKKKYGNTNKVVSSILSFCNPNNNIEFDNASKISNKTFNFNNNNNYVNNNENSFSSSKQYSLKCKLIGNPNYIATPILSSNTKRKNNFSNSKNNKKTNDNNNKLNEVNISRSNISIITNNNNKTKSFKSSICNFSTAKNTPDLRGSDSISKIAHGSFSSNQNPKAIEENNNIDNFNQEQNLNNINNYVINNNNKKKNSKLQETRELVKRINSKVKSKSNKDFEFLDNTIDEVHNNAILENTNKKIQEKIFKENSNYDTGSRIVDESKSNYFCGEEANKSLNNNKGNRNKNYGNIVYSVNSNENANKSIKNRSVISNNDMNNQENSRFDYSMSKTDGEVYFDK
jgi:hypothetical protein